MSPQDSEHDSDGDAQRHTPEPALSGGKADSEPTREKQNDSGNLAMWKDSQWWQVWVQAVLVPAGIGALFIYGCQLDEMKKSTNAAIESTRLTREMAHLDQRAWVAMQGVEGIPQAGQVLTIKTKCKNTGKTFAKRFTCVVAVQSVEAGGEPAFDQFDVEETKRRDTGSISLLPPNAEYGTEGNWDLEKGFDEGAVPITQAQIDTIKDGSSRLFVFGKLRYLDIFNCEHWTTFCWELLPTMRYRAYSKFNDADEDTCL